MQEEQDLDQSTKRQNKISEVIQTLQNIWIWNFQGYQRNSMWNFQGLINKEVEFPRVTKEK